MPKSDLEYFENLVDKFLRGEILEEEKIELKEFYKKDNDKELEKYIHSKFILRHQGEQKLKKKLNLELDAVEKGADTKKAAKIAYAKWLSFAAGFLLMFGLLFFFNQSNDQSSSQDQLEIHDPSFTKFRSLEENPGNADWNDALNHFEKGEYEDCLQIVKALRKDENFLVDNHGKLFLMKGVTEFRLKNPRARMSLNAVKEDSPYYDQALWFLALTAYEQKNKKVLEEALKKAEAFPKHFKLAEIRTLLSKLNNE